MKFYNGQILTVKGSYEATKDHLTGVMVRLEDDEGNQHFHRLWPFWNEGFFPFKDNYDGWNGEIQHRKEKGANKIMWGVDFDYAYCLTAHKAQGSEFDVVCVFDERNTVRHIPRAEKQRWYYTAITRAKKRILIVQ